MLQCICFFQLEEYLNSVHLYQPCCFALQANIRCRCLINILLHLHYTTVTTDWPVHSWRPAWSPHHWFSCPPTGTPAPHCPESSRHHPPGHPAHQTHRTHHLPVCASGTVQSKTHIAHTHHQLACSCGGVRGMMHSVSLIGPFFIPNPAWGLLVNWAKQDALHQLIWAILCRYPSHESCWWTVRNRTHSVNLLGPFFVATPAVGAVGEMCKTRCTVSTY